jgi:hypothetical protein
MKLRHLPSLCAALLALCSTLATAQTSAVPGFISYQGRVVDASGNNVGAGTPVNRTVIFRIWDTPSSTNTANLIYSEAQTVTVSDGEFSVLVGQGVANNTLTFGYSEIAKGLPTVKISDAFKESNRYLGVTVAAAATIATTDNEITPRQQIVSTAFAMRAKVAESVDANAISSAMLATGAVGSTQLAAASVTSAKLGTGAVLADNISNLNVTTGKIADLNVTTGKIANNAVDNTKLRDSAGLSVIGRTSSTVGDPADIVAASDGQVLRRSGTSVGFGTVGTDGIADAAITGAKISAGTVTATQIASATITANRLAADVGVWSVASNGLYANKRVSIGGAPSSIPDKAPFEVNTWGTGSNLGSSWRVYNTIVATTENQQLSIYAALDVSARQYYVRSDARIKKTEGRSCGVEDLASLMGIEVTDYRFKDVAVNGNRKQKKVIAQQVEAVFPQAVSQSCDVVPDIYVKAAIKEGWIALQTDLKKGERVRLIAQEGEGVFEVLEVSKSKFRTKFIPEGDEVFVFGREVNDFRTVDYDAIAMLNVSATQQIKQEKDAEIQTLRDENATLRRELAAKDASVEARLIALESRMSGKGVTETVSLKTVRVAE